MTAERIDLPDASGAERDIDTTATHERQAMIGCLEEACAQGLLRPLDLAFACFIARHDAQAPAALLAAAAWCSRAAGDGHLCLDLSKLGETLQRLFAMPSAVKPNAWMSDNGGPPVPVSAAVLTAGTAVGAGWEQRLPASADAAERAFAGASVSLAWAGADPQPQSSETGTSVASPARAPAFPLQPLVLKGSRLYLGRYWRAEQRIAGAALHLAAQAPQGVEGPAARAALAWNLDLLFAGAAAAGSAQQRLACERAAEGRLTLVTGGPGTGKTFTAARALMLLDALQRQAGLRPLRVLMAAPTGKAAARLRESVQAAWAQVPGAAAPQWEAGTLHRLLGLAVGAGPAPPAPPLRADVLLVDEASMIDADMMEALFAALPPNARLILLGDADQLASVEAGSVLADLAQAPPDTALAHQTVRLTHSHRFGGRIGQLAAAVRDGDAVQLGRLMSAIPPAQHKLSTGPAVEDVGDAAAVRWLGIHPQHAARLAQAAVLPGDWPNHGQWLSRLQAVPDSAAFQAWVGSLLQDVQRFRVLCALRDGPWGVSGLNQLIEQAAASQGWLRPQADHYEGRVVMVTRNDPSLQLFNGDIGLVLRSRPGPLRDVGLSAWFAGAAGAPPRAVAATRLPAVSTAFAMTVHKSQGSEFEHVQLVLPGGESPVLTRELLYTGITRARRQLTLCATEPGALLQALPRRTLRASGLRQALWALRTPLEQTLSADA